MSSRERIRGKAGGAGTAEGGGKGAKGKTPVTGWVYLTVEPPPLLAPDGSSLTPDRMLSPIMLIPIDDMVDEEWLNALIEAVSLSFLSPVPEFPMPGPGRRCMVPRASLQEERGFKPVVRDSSSPAPVLKVDELDCGAAIFSNWKYWGFSSRVSLCVDEHSSCQLKAEKWDHY